MVLKKNINMYHFFQNVLSLMEIMNVFSLTEIIVSIHAICINQTCDRIDGSCVYGCTEGDICDKGTVYTVLYSKNDKTLIMVYVFYIYRMLSLLKKN